MTTTPTAPRPTAPVLASDEHQPPRVSLMAVIGFALGLFPCTAFIGLGIIFSIIALMQISADKKHQTGSGFAIAGLALSAAWMVMLVLGLTGHLPFKNRGDEGVFALPIGREAVLSNNLKIIRRGISEFHADTGVFPDNLYDLIADKDAKLLVRIPPKTYQGPYLSQASRLLRFIGDTTIPANPMADPDDDDIDHHWRYGKDTGHVSSAVEGITSNGTPYGEL